VHLENYLYLCNMKTDKMPIIDEKWEENRRIIDEHNKFSPVTNYRGRKNPILLNSILIGTIIYILLTSIIDWLIG